MSIESVPFDILIKLCFTKALEWSSLVPGPEAKSSSSVQFSSVTQSCLTLSNPTLNFIHFQLVHSLNPFCPRSAALLMQTMTSPLGQFLSAREYLDQRLQFLYPTCVTLDIIWFDSIRPSSWQTVFFSLLTWFYYISHVPVVPNSTTPNLSSEDISLVIYHKIAHGLCLGIFVQLSPYHDYYPHLQTSKSRERIEGENPQN